MFLRAKWLRKEWEMVWLIRCLFRMSVRHGYIPTIAILFFGFGLRIENAVKNKGNTTIASI